MLAVIPADILPLYSHMGPLRHLLGGWREKLQRILEATDTGICIPTYGPSS